MLKCDPSAKTAIVAPVTLYLIIGFLVFAIFDFLEQATQDIPYSDFPGPSPEHSRMRVMLVMVTFWLPIVLTALALKKWRR